MSIKLNSKGFAAIEATLIVVILAILGGTGYYIYHANQKTNETLNTASQVSQSSPSKVSGKQPNINSSANKFLVIKEWGVKLPLSNEDSGAYYTYDSAASLNVTLYDGISIFDTSIDQLKNNNGTSCKDPSYPLFVISRAKTSDIKLLTDPTNPNFIGDTGPADFRTVSFTKNYEFAGSSAAQSAPQCELLDNTGKDMQFNAKADAKYSTVRQALTTSYNGMRAN